ncbi:MAG TPA: response regulator [Candidatus Bathyarchaeota archaeon]|nr:response regulator [Candidatus Bathyarchaeota archaeon]
MLKATTKKLQKKPVKSKPEMSMRVLHVDDDEDFLKCSKRFLEMQDSFQVETALSVKEALQKIRQKQYDVIVSDYQMPEASGLDLLKQLKKGGNDIPFILFTGKGREEVAIEALNLGADQYVNKIGKPEVIYSELTHIIKKVVKSKQAEKALQKSEENYRRLFENAPAVIVTMDLKGNVTSINKAAGQYGFKKDEFVGKNMRKFILKRYWPTVLKDLVQISRRKTVKSKIEIDTPKGNKIAKYNSSPIIIDNKVVGMQTILTDITEHEKLERQLKESEEKYRKQFEAAMDAIFLADAETGILVDCNRAATKLVGRKKSELIGKHQRILHPPEAIEDGFSITFKQHRKEKEAHLLEDYIITKDGKIRDVIINATTFELDGKRLLLATFRDVTNQKKVEEQLRRERETLELITSNIGAGLSIISKDYKILWANKFLKNVCGEDVKGKTCYSIYNDLGVICPGCGVKEIFETGKNHVVHEQSVPGLDGKRHWIEITANPIRDENGNIVAASELSVFLDERKQMEDELRAAENRYHAIFDKAPLGILIVDSTGIAVEFNEEAHRQLGYSREEFRKLTVADYEVVESAEEIKARMKKVLKTGKDRFETKHRTKTGEIRDVVNIVQLIELSGKKFFQVITQDITERKRAEEALKESEEKYRELLNGMNDTAWVIDLDGNFIDVNDAAVNVLGYSREELLSMGPKDLSKNLPEAEVKALIDNMPKDEIQVFEAIHFTKDGKQIPVEISSSLVTYKGKQAILSIARDIAERKKAREQLRQSEERYRTVFENTGTAMCILEEDKTISMINRRFQELSGYSPREVEGKKWTEFVTKDHLERMQRYHEIRRKRGRKAPTSYSFNFVDKKGQIRNCMITVNLIPRTKKSVASILDITESKKAAKALWAAEKKYRKTILSANVGIIGYSPEGKVKVLNPKMEQMTGFKGSEIPTLQDWFEKLYPNEEEKLKIRDKWLKKMSEEGEVKEGHAIITTKDGKRRNFLFNGVRLESGDSIAFAEDITERKEAEEKLNEIMNELVTINEKLGVVGRLTRHDARNKLSIIANNLYLAKQKLATNHSALEFLGDIESAIDQMEKIFDFARNYEMLGVEELSYMDVGKTVEEAIMLLSGMNGVMLVNKCKGLVVMADSLLRQLFYNLIDDTLKHGEKVSQIRVYYEEGEDQLKLVYEDDGVGIPEDEKEKIFGEGYGKGTGYGLYLIKKICEAYGWTIRETGEHGKGAQFTMTIPKTVKNGKLTYCFDNK